MAGTVLERSVPDDIKRNVITKFGGRLNPHRQLPMLLEHLVNVGRGGCRAGGRSRRCIMIDVARRQQFVAYLEIVVIEQSAEVPGRNLSSGFSVGQ